MTPRRPRRCLRAARRALAGLALLLGSGPALAHETGLSYLRVRVDARALAVELELGLGDAAAALGLDRRLDPDADPVQAREALWREIAPRGDALARRVLPALGFWQDAAPCQVSGVPAFDRAEATGFARLRFQFLCPEPVGVLGLAWNLPFEGDPAHRALVSVAGRDATQSAILSAQRRRVDLDLRPQAASAAFATFLVEGMRHITSGPDHLLFLIALLLPAPFRTDNRSGSLRASDREVLVDVVKIVTAFTVAHSLTLTLCVLGAVSLPARAVEAAIAASIVVAAANGVRPFLRARAWRVAFAFGLLHGLGFARYLAELGLPPFARASALLAFNLGVELGQLGVVIACLPLLLVLGRQPFYRRWLLPAASAAIALLASLWLVERLSA